MGRLLAVLHDSNGRYGKQYLSAACLLSYRISIGSFFAVATSICLKFAVGVAYFQIVWYKLRCKFVSLKTIDNTFDALGNILSFLDFELLTKLNYAVPIAIIVWYRGPPLLLTQELIYSGYFP